MYGEYIVGGVKGIKIFVIIILGIGIGGGIIIDGKIYIGVYYVGVEFGYMVICVDGE